MKFSEQWLREWVNPTLDTIAFSEQLAMIGLTVDDIKKVAGDFTGVVVGEIVTRIQHPNADKLSCCEVNIGKEDLLKIVCGAPNARAGIKVAVATVGAVLPGNFNIKEAKLRGELSQGMLCSAKELQLEMGKTVFDGIIELPKDAPIGEDFRVYFKANDHIIDVDVTPNRGDALSIRGVARDLAAVTTLSAVTPEIKISPVVHHGNALPVVVEATDACPRFVGQVIKNVNMRAQTPSYMQMALQRANIRTINPIVDVTNYVMLELGQPMHAYDLSTLSEKIIVRCGQNEKLMLLDGQEITVTSNDLVIADAQKPLALAGIMGGLTSGVTDQTTDIFLEAAFFTPKNICLSKRRHQVSSESSHRFERGVDFENTSTALDRAVQLIVSITGGEPCEKIDVKNTLPARHKIILPFAQIERMLGIVITDHQIETIFHALGMQEITKTATGFEVTPPSFRFDLTLPIDLIEELARMVGYQTIPAASMTGVLSMNPIAEAALTDEALRQRLVNRGYQEAITYSFISADRHALFSKEAPIALNNPLSQTMAVMRPSLLPGLLEAVQMNVNNQQARVRLFETGLCFSENAQTSTLALVATGSIVDEQWGEKTRLIDFFDVKNDLLALFDLTIVAETTDHFHPGRSCALYYQDKRVGFLGEIHPVVLQHYDIKQPVIACEVDLTALRAQRVATYHAFSRFPSVRRDLALILDEIITSEQLCAVIRKTGGELLENAHVFDVYQGKGIAPGKKSIAVGLTFVHPSRTLRDEEIQEAIQGVIAALTDALGATLRM